jgi:hypothetical protein
MNQQIAANIEYLKYKDQKRFQDLKSSQVSHKSNRSNHSLKPYHYSSSKSTSSYKQNQDSMSKLMHQPIITSIPSKEYFLKNEYRRKERGELDDLKDVQTEHLSSKIKSYYIPPRVENKKHNLYTSNYYKSPF